MNTLSLRQAACAPAGRKEILFYLSALVIALAGHAPAFGQAEEEPPERAALSKEVASLFEQGKFDALEEMASTFRKGERFTEGIWKLPIFYNALDPDEEPDEKKGFDRWLKKVNAWQAARPDSVTPRVVRGMGYVESAWDARGRGWARTVTEEGWRLMALRLETAEAAIEEALALPEKCPHAYATLMVVALGQGWSRPSYEALFDQAVAFAPTYHVYYFNKARYLLPRWGGGAGEWERFAEKAGASAQKEGPTMYARIAWANSWTVSNLFQETRIRWPRMKKSFEALLAAFPDSKWNLNAFAKFAWQAGDKATLETLLAQIGNSPALGIWESPAAFEQARRLASGATQAVPVTTLAGDFGPATSCAFSPDGALLAVGYGRGKVRIFRTDDWTVFWEPEEMEERVPAVAFSPDGNLLAVAQGRENAESKGLVRILDLKTLEVRATVNGWRGSVADIAFTADAKSLVMVGGIFDREGEIRIWNVKDGSLSELDWAAEQSQRVRTLALSPDGRILVVDRNLSITVWDLHGEKSLFDTRQSLKNRVEALAFSPDGTLLAAGTGAGWENRHAPTPVVLWNVPDFVERTPPITTEQSGLMSVAFSPDGRMLAGGGYDECIRFWDVATGREIDAYFGHNKMIHHIAFSPSGRLIASASEDGTVRLWTPPTVKSP